MITLRILCFGVLPWWLSAATAQIPPPIPAAAPLPIEQLGTVAGNRYHGDGLSLTTTPDGAHLRCTLQQLEGRVTRDGLWLNSTANNASGESFRVTAVAVGRATDSSSNDFNLSHDGSVTVADKVARFIRPSLTEEYSVSVEGVRQDFLVAERPTGAGEMRLELDVAGAQAEPMANGARLVPNRSGRELAYNRLRVTDARGRELSARLEVTSLTRLAVVVDDARAVYPVRIDPTFSDADWQNWSGLPGADGTVSAAVFDGSGNLYIGGSFNVVGNVVAKQIAKWDGNNWSSLGGINGTVSALAFLGPDLYVGGSFNLVGVDFAGGILASNIARWNGSAWSAVGTSLNGPVSALAASGSTLYVGGTFSLSGDTFVLRVAKWDGSAWSGLGAGLNNTVTALAVMGGDLYAGGTFTLSGSTSVLRIAKWNGTAWSAVGSGMSGAVNALAASGTDLYAAGTFTIPGNNIAKWNGSAWSTLGTGLGNTANALAIAGTNVYVGGAFTTPATRLARWDGSTWSALGTGASSTVSALAVSGSLVVAGGAFTTTPAMRVASWDGNTWTNLGAGLNGQVNAVAISGTDVYLGGGFTFRNVPGAVNLVHWNGSAWSALGGGLNGSVNALVCSGGQLYAGGAFTTATNTGGAALLVNRLAKWDGTAWSALDAGLNGTVSALTTSGSDLYVGGGFTTAGSAPAYNIAKWNGSSWTALAGGLSTTVNGAVKALAASSGNLYAAGEFTTATNAGGVSLAASRIARWDGSAWSALGSGMDNPVSALAVSGSTLYAGGFFGTAGGVPVGRIAQWNGTAWSVLGTATNNIFVNALAVSGSDLYVGGIFSTVGTVPANNLAKWDGTNWTALGSGLSGTSIPSVNALTADAGTLYTGGSFTRAGDKAAGYVAKATIPLVAAPGRFSHPTYSPVTGFSCTFLDATVGQPYRIQTSSTLASGSWTEVANFNYTAPVLLTLPPALTNRFIHAVTP